MLSTFKRSFRISGTCAFSLIKIRKGLIKKVKQVINSANKVNNKKISIYNLKNRKIVTVKLSIAKTNSKNHTKTLLPSR